MHKSGMTVLRVLRKQHGWTQTELGEKAGLYQGEISRAESGQPVRNLALVAIHLGVDDPKDLLLDWDEYRDRQVAGVA